MEQSIVLVVEDEKLLREAIEKKLKLNNIIPIVCDSGKDAVEYLRGSSTMINAIWLDYRLKDMDGLEFMSVIKEKQEWSKIPVIVVSNSASPSIVSSMLALGVKRYLLKADHRLDEIISIINHFIKTE